MLCQVSISFGTNQLLNKTLEVYFKGLTATCMVPGSLRPNARLKRWVSANTAVPWEMQSRKRNGHLHKTSTSILEKDVEVKEVSSVQSQRQSCI